MMKRLLILAAALVLAACSSESVTPTPPAATVAPSTQTAGGDWVQFADDEIRVAIQTPAGWMAVADDYGILLAEHAEPLGATTQPDGMIIYIFVPAMDEINFTLHEDANMAWEVLSQVAKMPDYVHDAVVSEPVAFEWDGHQAAYYLLTSHDGSRTVVLAVALPAQDKLIVANVSAPAHDAHHIRDMLPGILSSFTVNGKVMTREALDALPDPLPFPNPTRATQSGATQTSG
jgi:hypothetical protein